MSTASDGEAEILGKEPEAEVLGREAGFRHVDPGGMTWLDGEARRGLPGDSLDECLALYGPPQTVKIADLVRRGSPRAEGEDHEHVQRLAQAESKFPPILVHRSTMRVIDGFHRVAATICRGMDEIDVCFIDGQLESAFIVGVKANIFHGLPLSLPDRRAAATRILRTHPEWSDRAIGDSTGLSARTVHAVRLSNEQYQKPDKRLGKDGRLRPLDASVGRKLAADLLSERPEASLREIADAAGVSPGTVRDVRDRLRRGDDPVPSSEGDKHETTPPTKAPPKIIAHIACKALDVNPVLRTLARDPALSMNCTGRELLRWLHVHAVNSADTAKLSSSLPEHCIEHLVELAIRCSANWAAIAQHLAKPPLAEPPLA